MHVSQTFNRGTVQPAVELITRDTLAQVVGRAGQRLTLGMNNHMTVYGGTHSSTLLGKLFNNQHALLNEERQRYPLLFRHTTALSYLFSAPRASRPAVMSHVLIAAQV
jgi:hypothetical protein